MDYSWINFQFALLRISLVFLSFPLIFSHFLDGAPDSLQNTLVLKVLRMVNINGQVALTLLSSDVFEVC